MYRLNYTLTVKSSRRVRRAYFTTLGVGGAIVLRLSRQAVDALIDEHHVELRLDLKPALSVEQLNARFEREKAALSDKAPIRHLLAKLVPSLLIGNGLVAQNSTQHDRSKHSLQQLSDY